ncbi:MAG TPA: haloacid dehalogenase-like hydrolase [Gemmatimonadales bacterium]|jgi:phosphoglycolate phosphatase|nr:haloacid dehalogenase-like hydrolase [Gemmatimonadales bacterium]
MQLLLFDIDGTLLNTDGAGRRAIHRALIDRAGTPGVLPGYRLDGKTDPQIVRELLAQGGHASPDDLALVEEICTQYVTHLAEELERPGYGTRAMPGVPALLEALAPREAAGEVMVGLLTGNVVGGAALKLKAAGIGFERFAVGAYGLDGRHRPDLPPVALARASALLGRPILGTDTWIIGDTPADVACGRPVGARALAVATGSYGVADLEATGAELVFADLSDTNAVLEGLGV